MGAGAGGAGLGDERGHAAHVIKTLFMTAIYEDFREIGGGEVNASGEEEEGGEEGC